MKELWNEYFVPIIIGATIAVTLIWLGIMINELSHHTPYINLNH